MTDPRVNKLADVLIHYSLDVQPGQQMVIQTSPLADELTLACYAEALRCGAHVFIQNQVPGQDELYYKLASDAQLEYISPIRQMVIEKFDTMLNLWADYNTRELSGVNPSRMALRQKANAPLSKTYMTRAARGELHWCITVYPTQAMAQDADMSLSDYQDFVYKAGKLDESDPVAAWKAEYEHQLRLVEWLKGKDRAVLKGNDIDLTLSIKGRTFDTAAGKFNFPDGEIYTGPVENSANGWVRFRYPGIYEGQEIQDIELRFEDGKVVSEKASKGQELLTSLLNMDAGSRYLGELGIGTNYDIPRFTKNMLFDEKLGGTIHMAVGAGYPETGSKNESGLHWDMLCDMHESEITVDGELFYKEGKVII